MKTLLPLILALFCIQSQAQNTGDYRSVISGNWNDVSTWERYNGTTWQSAPVSPSSASGVIEIRSLHTVLVNTALTIDQLLISGGGTLSVTASLTVTDGPGIDFSLLGTVTGSGSTTINGSMEWAGSGIISSPFVLTSGAVLNISGNQAKAWSSSTTNAGTINWAGSSFLSCNGLTLDNNGTFNASGNGWLINDMGTNAFNNSGTFSKTGGNGRTFISIPATNTGTINVNSGTIALGDSCANTGTVNIAGGAAFQNYGALIFNAGTALNGSGTFLMNGSHTFNVPLNIPATMLVNLTSGGMQGSGIVTINGTMNWTGGNLEVPLVLRRGSVLNITDIQTKFWSSGISTNAGTINLGGGMVYIAGALTNTGTINWTSSATLFCNGFTLDNSGTIDASGDGTLGFYGGANIFNNSGTLSKTGGSETTSINIATNNTGVIKGNGTINFGSSFRNNGKISPGLSVGSLTMLSADPVFTANSSLVIDLQNHSGPGIGNDLLKVGTVSLNGNLTLAEIGAPAAGSDTIIRSTGEITGTFSSVTQTGGYTVTYRRTAVIVTKAQSPLPVHLLSFSANQHELSVDLTWKTANEYNSDHFVVEKSGDAVSFVQIGNVRTNGTNSGTTDYAYRDNTPYRNISYYRLKIVDKDGKIEYSKIVKTDRSLPVSDVVILPNPVVGSVTVKGLSANGSKTIQLFDTNGRLMAETITGDKQVIFNLADSPQGVYWIQITQNGTRTSRKIVKQ